MASGAQGGAEPPQAALAALRDLLGPRGLTTDPADLDPWLTDWRGRYRGAAAALLAPSSREEVVAAVKIASEHRLAIVPQGGNSSMVGGATPDASGRSLLLSLRRMDRIRSLDPEAGIAVAEAGVILEHLHRAAEARDMRFPLTLGARGSATIGGLVSTNAGGTQVLRHGPMRNLVLGVEAVLPDGSLFEGLAPLRKDNRGYNLTQLLIGAEGTLGIVTAASLKLVPAIGARAVAWIGLDRPESAMALLRLLEARTGQAVEAFELVPASALALVLAHVPGTRAPLSAPAPWNVLVEAVAPRGGPDPAALLEAALAEAAESGLIADAALAASEAQAEALWKLRDSISEAEKKDGPAAKHDISVPVAAMAPFMVAAAGEVEARFAGTRVNAFGHLGDGNVHFNVRAPAGAGADWLEARGSEISAFVHDLVIAAGGSISAEHGIGQMKVHELARTGEPARLGALRAIKRALDPLGIMNPGKLVPPA
jgi:FAD/FMN-containing dehydrogenase